MNDGTVLILEHVARSYRLGDTAVEVLRDVNLELPRGSWCCIYGASGSGKTTLLNLIGALEKPDDGRIVIDGTELGSLSRRAAAKFRSSRIGFVFQSYQLVPELTILENAMLAGRFCGLGARKAQDRARELLVSVGLEARLEHRPSELSGGEQQRAAIARALMNDPALLLADEPTGNLDHRSGAAILDLFCELRCKDPSRTLVMITHNRDIAALADRVVELKDGILQ